MSRFFATAIGLTLLTASLAYGQDAGPPNVTANPRVPAAQLGSPSAYASDYTRESSRDYIRRRAQEAADARRARIEGMKWLGYSPLRPTTTAVPFMGHPPTWNGNQFWNYPGASYYWYLP